MIGEREAAAVAEWVASGLPFHVMRDWYTHTDPMLSGMWGGIAGVFPGMASRIAAFRDTHPVSTNWDQHFLREEVWPAIRDHVMVHDRLFDSHRAQPFPGPVPAGTAHVGQNEHGAPQEQQAARLSRFAGRVPALGLPRPRVSINLGKIGQAA